MINKILVVFGTRPEAIKMAPLVKELKKVQIFETKVCVTAQHREMLDQVLDFFNIIPDFDLNLMKRNQTLNELSSRILGQMDAVFSEFEPDLVLVHGDTTTSSCVALAAFHSGIKIGHVEAGLRTYNKFSPFPEEVNRQITSRLADFHFAPTERSKENLLSEKVSEKSVFVTGNTVIDALLWGVNNVDVNRKEIKEIKEFIDPSKKLIVVTGHRRENFGSKFNEFCLALKELSGRTDVQIIYPVHLNPNIKKVVYEKLSNIDNIKLMSPLEYEVFIWLLKESYLVITDSGGIQEEAPSLGVPVIVTRDTTERQEAIDSGNVILVGTDKTIILESTIKLLENIPFYKDMTSKKNPYGDGNSCQIIVDFLANLG
jgi:UDP-N-acetylglucosamine 2-epimerase (non-hydrolysing)